MINYPKYKRIKKKILNVYVVAITKRDFYFIILLFFGGEIHPFGIHLYENLYRVITT